jgi:protein-tyrosine phosphatase
MVKVLMVCLGNICRSPLAEGILKSKVDDAYVFVDSAGTGGWHIGELPDVRSIGIARQNKIDISDQRCRKFIADDFDDFDFIYVMDRSNLSDVLSLAKSETHRNKVKMILSVEDEMDFTEVPDPYYGGERGFEEVFSLLDNACEQIAKSLENEK